MPEQKTSTLLPRFADERVLEKTPLTEIESRPKQLHYWGDAETANADGGCVVDDACISAMETVSASGERQAVSGQFGGNPLASNPDEHPDARVIRDWLASINRTPSDLHVIFWLAYFVRNEWANFPKRTRSEHRDLYQRIATLCHDLCAAMDETKMHFMRGEGYGFQALNVRDLLTGREVDDVVTAGDHARGMRETSRIFNKDERRLFDLLLCFPVVGLPTVQTLLDRVGSEAKRLEKMGPLHAQPNKRGAERGYFVRRIAELFARRYGEQPHEVIAALATIALGEATDRELVAKLLA